MAGPHLDDDTVLALLERALVGERLEAAQAHLDGCADCRALVSAAAPTSPRVDTEPLARPPDRLLEPGDTVGRYVVQRLIGVGGMGVVYEARDPELNRKVAIKLLRPEHLREGAGEELARRLTRESRALALLSHPNVVAVHDVGRQDGALFVAMELVEGQTLTAWCRERRRPWRDLIAVAHAAASGLAAAHGAGLVHRDIKPENILVVPSPSARHGFARVVVTDFGLARSATGALLTTMGTGLKALTVEGAIMGTPAYMAPEQYWGEPADPRTDVFSFCATLYEALFGVRPFPGKTAHAIAAAMEAGPAQLPARPFMRWRLRRLLLRGLAIDRRERPASMAEVARELGVVQRQGTWLTADRVIAALVVIGITVAAIAVAPARQESLCADPPAQVAPVWGAVRRSAMAARFTTHAADWQRASAALDRLATDWIDTTTRACLSKEGKAVRKARTSCLRTQLAQVAAALELAEAEPASFDIPHFLATMPSPQVCMRRE
jgi:hypothetical protein